MKETPEKLQESEEKAKEQEQIGKDMEIKTEMKREAGEADDESEKIQNVNILTEGLKAMNIKPDSDEEDSDSSYTIRGPNGGKPAMFQYSTTDKPLPMPPMPNNFGAGQNYMAYTAQMQKPGRRMPEEPSQQPYKYTRPQPQPEMTQQQFAPVLQNNQFAVQPNFCNNLSQPSNSGQQNNFSSPPQMFNFGADPTTATTTMTQMRFTGSSSGGIVKVQSPVSNMQAPFANTGGNVVDAFLEGMNIPDSGPDFNQLAQNVQNARSVPNQLPPCSVQPSPINDTYSRKAFTEARRCSDPDSGVESAEERSPYSVQTPSPASSVYTSPPSVDSACGLSPNYDAFSADKGCALNGMSSPKYPGMQSPASYRTTPSPASTSGYGSPMAPHNDEEMFNDKRIDDLKDVLDVIGHDLTRSQHADKNLRKSIESQQMEISQFVHQKQPVPPVAPINDLHMVSRPLNAPVQTQQNFVQMPQQIPAGIAPQATATVPTQSVPMAPAIPAAGSQPSNIIILPPSSTQPIYVIPVSTQQQQQKKPEKKLRPILPKISKAPTSNSNNTTSSAMTSTCPSNKTDVTMATKVTPATGGKPTAQTQAQGQKTDRLLMIARRTVASIPREHLRKSDEEGDTYLHIAVCRTDRHMVQALLERLHRESLDSLVDQENHKRQTPLYLAVYVNQPVMVNMFIRFKANVNVLAQNLSADGQTTEVKAAIHVAAAHGGDYLKTLTELLKAKDLSINIVNNYGQTALHCAILAHGKAKRNSPERINSIDIIKTLLRHTADPTAQDKKSGKTPLMYAIEQRNLELVEAILSQVEPEKVKNVVKTQAFDGSSCLKIAEGLKDSYNVQIWNKLWNSLQSAASGSVQHLSLQQVY